MTAWMQVSGSTRMALSRPTSPLVCALIIILGFGALRAQTQGLNCSAGEHEAKELSNSPGGGDYDRPVSWKTIVPNILCDEKAIWLFPTKLGKTHVWIPTLGISAVAAGLVTADPAEGRYFHQTSAFRGFNNVFTSSATAWGTVIAPVSLYATGLIRHDSKMQRTALLAAEAVANAEILTTVLKDVGKRARPATFPSHGNYWDSWFDSKGSVLRSNGSFPSGHTIAAFSIATVIAHRYRAHRWVPYVAYGSASLVGFSRLTLSAHFASDVFMGAALGYSISRFAVLRY